MNLPLRPLLLDHLELRQLTLSDADNLFTLTDKNRNLLKEWLGWLDSTKTVEDTKKFILTSIDRVKEGNGADLGIYENNTLVGVIGFPLLDRANKKAIIGYWLDQDSQGKGIMTVATKMLMRFAFDELGLNRITITCAVGNEKSCAIPNRLGFTHEGVERQTEWLYDHFVDWNVFSLLKEDWLKQSNETQ